MSDLHNEVRDLMERVEALQNRVTILEKLLAKPAFLIIQEPSAPAPPRDYYVPPQDYPVFTPAPVLPGVIPYPDFPPGTTICGCDICKP